MPPRNQPIRTPSRRHRLGLAWTAVVAACVAGWGSAAVAETRERADQQPSARAAADTSEPRPRRRMVRVSDEVRTWPTPLIAPWEGFDPGSIRFDPVRTSNCFGPGSKPTDAALQDLERRMRVSPLRYYTAGARWPSRTITWSFVPDGTPISRDGAPNEASTLFAELNDQFGNSSWINRFEVAFGRWSQLTGIQFVRVRFNGTPWDDGASWETGVGAAGLRGDIRIGARSIDGPYDVAATCAYPPLSGSGASGSNGNMTLDIAEDWAQSADDYRFFNNVILHELGHGLGLSHTCPNNDTKLMESTLVEVFYGPQHDDIRGAHALYGDVYEPNDTAATATVRATLGGGSTDVIGPIPAPAVPYSTTVSIVPNTDQDWYRYNLSVPTTVSVTLTPVGHLYAMQCFVGEPPNAISQSAQATTLSLIGGNGTTVIASTTSNNLGEVRTLSNISMPSGTFYVRVAAQDVPQLTTTQMYQLSVIAGPAPIPVNDACAGALAIGLGTTIGNNFGASGSVTTSCGQDQDDVWYAYTPTCGADLVVDTCGSALDTTLTVYTACNGSPLACNDNAVGGSGCDGADSRLTVSVNPGITYYIRVGGRSAENTFSLNLSLAAPANDLCANATLLPATFSLVAETCAATPDGTQTCAVASPTPDVWYRYVPTCAGSLAMDTCGSTLDTVLVLYSGTCGALTQIGCSDDVFFCPPRPDISRIVAPVTPGQTYYIRVAGFAGSVGRFQLSGRMIQANDTCATAAAITPGITAASLCAATRDSNSSCAAASTSPDVYYSYVPAISGSLLIDTCNTTFDTVLELFTGACESLVSVACNNDQGVLTCPSAPTTSRITFNVTAGTPYILRVSGANGAQGDFNLRLNQAPANDLCANAPTIPSGTLTSTTAGAARERNDTCTPTATAPDVYYRWVAPCTGTATISTCGSLFDTTLAFYSGANCSVMTQVACNDNTFSCGGGSVIQSSLSAPVTAGTAYFIRVSGGGNASGTFTLNVSSVAANDNCASPAAATVGNTPFDTQCASNDGQVLCGASNSSPDVWFRFTSPCNGAVWFDLCNSSLDTVLTVNSGSCGSFVPNSCNDNQGAASCPGNPSSSRGVVRAVAGTNYTIRIAGNFGLTGAGNLNIRCCPADYNLSFTVSVQDIFDFLAGYFAGLPAADVNNSGTVSVQDIFDFLAAYFAGCS